jgi:hypothetical protein
MVSTIHSQNKPTPVSECAVPELMRAHIKSADAWHIVVGSGGRAYQPVWVASPSRQAMEKVYYTDTQLGALDPRLPEVMRLLVSNVGMVATNVRATLRLWNNELRLMPENMFDTFKNAYHAELASFTASLDPQRSPTSQAPCVLVRFRSFDLACTESGTLYVERCRQPNFALNKAWLDEARPGWRDVILLAGALDMSETQFAQLLLFAPMNDVALSPALPGLDLP